MRLLTQDQAADLSESLFVGDAIVSVNEASIETATHDEAVATLKNAGEQVTLTVRHFPAATPFLVKAGSSSNAGSSNYRYIEKTRPIRCAVWIVKRLRYRPTDRPTDTTVLCRT